MLGWLLVVLWSGVLVAVAMTTPHRPRVSTDRSGPVAAASFVDAWERARTATFVRTGTFERRSEVTGSVITSDDLLVQRPPDRLHRQLGGVDGRRDDRLLVCPAPVDGAEAPPCQLGDEGGTTYDEDVAAEVAALRSFLVGPRPLYDVSTSGDGCFELDQTRPEPRAAFGVEARFCFDGPSGAPTNSRVRYEGGIVEVVATAALRTDVVDEDLEP
jgi:hypothetical protein